MGKTEKKKNITRIVVLLADTAQYIKRYGDEVITQKQIMNDLLLSGEISTAVHSIKELKNGNLTVNGYSKADSDRLIYSLVRSYINTSEAKKLNTGRVEALLPIVEKGVVDIYGSGNYNTTLLAIETDNEGIWEKLKIYATKVMVKENIR
jgi:hypothetical protein